MKKILFITLLLIFCSVASNNILAGGVYQKPKDFINHIFNNAPPKVEVLWLTKDLKTKMSKILSHNYKGLRIRYWQQKNQIDRQSVWILDEIGKEKPITTGIVVKNGKIELVKILVFRESRGWEIRHAFFTDQFKQAKLKESKQLSTNIDNISGATLSVRAVKKLAKIALLLDNHINQK